MTERCEHKTSVQIHGGDGYDVNLCTWDCGEAFITTIGNDGVTKEWAVPDLVWMANKMDTSADNKIVHQEEWVNGNMLILIEHEATITENHLKIEEIQSDPDTEMEVHRVTRVWPLGDDFPGQLNTVTAKETIRQKRKGSGG